MKNNTILFSRFEAHGSNEKFNDVYQIEPNGSNELKLTENPDSLGKYHDHTSARYNNDRTKIAYLNSAKNLQNFYDIFVKDLTSGSVAQITNNSSLDISSVDWSPDDNLMVITALDENDLLQIFTINADGTNLTKITSAPSENSDAMWSPSGQKIVFTKCPIPSNRTHCEIWTINPDGTNPIQLRTDDTRSSSPNWSPDGSSVVYACFKAGLSSHIKKIDIETGAIVEMTELTQDVIDHSPIWSTIGIVFSSNRDWDNSETFNLYVMNADGSNVRRITNNETYEYASDW